MINIDQKKDDNDDTYLMQLGSDDDEDQDEGSSDDDEDDDDNSDDHEDDEEEEEERAKRRDQDKDNNDLNETEKYQMMNSSTASRVVAGSLNDSILQTYANHAPAAPPTAKTDLIENKTSAGLKRKASNNHGSNGGRTRKHKRRTPRGGG